MCKRNFYFIILSFLAGVMIALGGTVYLSIDNKVVGSLMFSFGLLMVLNFKLPLYTGKIGYLLDSEVDSKRILYYFLMIFGNMAGVFAIGSLLKNHISVDVLHRVHLIVLDKLSVPYSSIFYLSAMCGVLMYLAVETYFKQKSSLERVLAVMMAVSIFILSGYEHCIANMYYFSLVGIWGSRIFYYLIVMVIGNTVGSVIISELLKSTRKLNKL